MNTLDDWQDYKDSARSSKVLDEDDRLRLVKALQFFRDEPRGDFIHDFDAGEHPIHQLLRPWSLAHSNFLIWLAEELERIIDIDGGRELLHRLETPTQFDPTIAEIETAARLNRAGLSFDFEPKAKVGGRIKQPDFQVHTGNGFPCSYLEVKHLRLSVTYKRKRDTLMRVRTPGPPFFAIIHRMLSPEVVRDINQQINELSQTIRQEGGVRMLDIPNKVFIVAGGEATEQEVKRRAEERGAKFNSMVGPVENRGDEVLRIKKAIQEKVKQLPHDYPGLISIKAPSIFLGAQSVFDVLLNLEEEMHRHRQLGMLLIHGTALNNATPFRDRRGLSRSLAFQYEDHVYAEYFSRKRFMVDRVLVLRNKYSTFDNLFHPSAAQQLASSVITGFEAKPLPRVEIHSKDGSDDLRSFIGRH
jgi:hypothetical protein